VNVLPRSLPARLALASLGAVSGVLALQHAVRAPVLAASRPAHAPAPAVPALAPLPFRVGAIDGEVLLCQRERAVPPTAAPVLRVHDDGTIVAQRPPVTGARDAAILLPRAPFAAWSPAARAALLEALAALLPARPMPTGRVRPVDVALSRGEIDALGRWVP
jgi:hypothetical protein